MGSNGNFNKAEKLKMVNKNTVNENTLRAQWHLQQSLEGIACHIVFFHSALCISQNDSGHANQ